MQRSTTPCTIEYADIAPYVRDGIITDELIKNHQLACLQVLEAHAKCKSCKGAENCNDTCLPYITISQGLYLTYGFCEKGQALNRQKKMDRLLSSSRIPKLFKTKTFDNFKVTNANRPAYESAVKVSANTEGKGIILAGTPGTGKTHLATAILNVRVQKGQEAIFCTVPELLSDIRRTFGSKNETSELMELVKTADLLILDDLGVEKVTDWVLEELFIIINSRLNNEKQTIFTTNYVTPSTLIAKMGGIAGQRIVSRIKEMCDWVKVEGEDYRLKL